MRQLKLKDFGSDIMTLPEHTSQLPSDVQAQLQREMDDWLLGRQARQARVAKTIEKERAGELRPFRRLRSLWAEPLAQLLEEERARLRTRRGPKPRWVQLTKDIPADRLAEATLELLLCQVAFTPGTSLFVVTTSVGRGVMHIIHMHLWATENPKLYRAYQKRLAEAGSTAVHRARVLRHGYNKRFLPEVQDTVKRKLAGRWTRADIAAVGRHLVLYAVAASGGRLCLEDGVAGRRGTKPKAAPKVLRIDDETAQWVQEALKHDELRARIYRPMVCRPIPWRGPYGGGYLLGVGAPAITAMDGKEAARRVLVRLKQDPRQADQVYRALNHLGKVAWAINPGVLSVALEAAQAGIPLPDLPLRGRRQELPPKPANIDTDEAARKAWRQAAARVHDANLKAVSSEWRAVSILAEADKLKGLPLYFPHHCDFRGRLYPVPVGLHPQGSDLARALLMFHAGKPLEGDAVGWLAAAVAKTCGRDKLPYAERIQWVYDNQADILAVADDPLGNRELWQSMADTRKLWACLAACREWARYCAGGEGTISHLPVWVDGTCNGLQHFAALARDPELGSLVNLVPGEAPRDIYQAVADRAYELVRRDAAGEPCDKRMYAQMWLATLGEGAPRKLAKRVVMVKPYGGTLRSAMDYAGESLDDLDPHHIHVPGEHRWKARGYMGQVLTRALEDRVQGAERVMAWLKDTVSKVNNWGLKPGIEWSTPVGWPWVQAYGVMRRTHIEAVGPDQKRYPIKHMVESPTKIDAMKQRNGVSPNFVHALDAAAMVMTVNLLKDNEVVSIGAIHDSVGGLAADMSLIDRAIRIAFVGLYTEHDPLRSFYEAACDQVPENVRHLMPVPPETGSLDVREVLASDYFFH